MKFEVGSVKCEGFEDVFASYVSLHTLPFYRELGI